MNVFHPVMVFFNQNSRQLIAQVPIFPVGSKSTTESALIKSFARPL